MYLEFLQKITWAIRALNRVEAKDGTDNSLTPYLNHVPVVMAEELQGFIHDEADGQYSYRVATDAEQDWWALRPWAQPRRKVVVAGSGLTTTPNVVEVLRPDRIRCLDCTAEQDGCRTFCRQCGSHLHVNAEGKPDVR